MATDARELYITALRNTHAVELQALQIMERQVERLSHYPEMEGALRRHIEETHAQRDRLESAMKGVSASPSTVKEGFLGFVGNMMALGHTPAQDEIVKNALANQAFENYEIAAYRSLMAFADAAGRSQDNNAFKTSLDEEEAMARTVAEMVPTLTARYINLTISGEKADR